VGVTYPIFAKLDLPPSESDNRRVLAYLSYASLLDGHYCRDPANPPMESRPGHEKGTCMLAVDADRLAIRELVENWALWRDAGDWERFATVWEPTEGWMTATWF